MYLNDLRLTSSAKPLRELLAGMREHQARTNSEYLHGYCAAIEFTLNLLGITERE